MLSGSFSSRGGRSFFLRLFFAYFLFSGLLLIIRNYLDQANISPFFSAWYAQDAPEIQGVNEEESDFFIEDPTIWEPVYGDEDLSPIDKEFLRSTDFETSGVRSDIAGIQLKVFGNSNVSTSYGFSRYLSGQDARNDIREASAVNIREDFFLAAGLNMNLKGKIGKRVLVDIDYDQNERLLNNQIKLKYFALHKKEFIREVTVGNVDFDFPENTSTKFKGFQRKNRETLGVDATFKKGKLNFRGVATLTGGETETEIFTGKTQSSRSVIAEYSYQTKKHFQLEPFLYYDQLSSPPTIDSDSYSRSSPNRLITLTSLPDQNIAEFTPGAVNIDSGSLEVWLDDRDPTNDQALNAQTKRITGNDLGRYHLLREADDYRINYLSGRLEFVNPIRESARVYVRYTLGRGGTSDPSARTDVDGKIETFIHFGSSMNEDINSDGSQDIRIIDDGRTNYDIYEVRGVYDLGSNNLQKNQFQLEVVDRNRNIIPGLNDQLGGYEVDFQQGLIRFYLREPFKAIKNLDQEFILSDAQVREIYSEARLNPAESSIVAIQTNLVEEVQNYKLVHAQIIKNSVRVKIDGEDISPNLYTVDHLLGFLHFKDPQNPVISPGTRVEVTYQYSPFGQTTNGFITGLRSEYNVSEGIQLGNTILYNAQFEENEAPRVGEESVSRFILENDLSIKLKEEKLTRFINQFSNSYFDLIPIRYDLYGEYTNSFYNPNTVGRALIDDMETSEEKIDISVSDRDWQISSLTPSLGFTQCDRAPLLYRYYRDLNNLELGPTPLATPVRASPGYRQLAGPYNVSEGHLSPEQLEQSEKQISLVMDFDFSGGGKVASIVTRRFSSQAEGRNLSQVEYIEFSAKLIDAASLPQGVSVRFDLGDINEDSDEDGRLDTEDVGSDGINNDQNGDGIPDSGNNFSGGERNDRIDQVVGGFTEDIGYKLDSPMSCPGLNTTVGAGPSIPGNPRTDGNGVLNTEDLNGDGRLDTEENIVIFDENDRNYIYFDTAPGLTPSNIISQGDWHLVRMNLDRAQLSDAQLQALRRAKSIRLYILPAGTGSGTGSGRLLIDHIKLGSSQWRRKRLRAGGLETSLTDPSILSVSTIDNQGSRSEYGGASFIKEKSDEYEDLHGSKTNSERLRVREAALKMSYDFSQSSCSPNTCEYAFVRRVFLRSLDLRYYRKVNIWVNYRELNTANDLFFVRLGSSDNDYIQLEKEMSGSGWQLLSFDLPEPLEDDICPERENHEGCPNLKQINTVALGIRNGNTTQDSRGVIWVNDIFVSETNIQRGDSYTIKNYLEIIKPLYKTKAGIPVLDRIRVSYERHHRGSNFFNLNQVFNNISTQEDAVHISTDILPFWKGKYLFSQTVSESSTNEFQNQRDFDGKVTRLTHGTQHDFEFEGKHYPRMTLKYEYQGRNIRKQNIIDHIVDTQIRSENTQEDTYVPHLSIHQVFPELWGQRITFSMKANIKYFVRDEELVLNRSLLIPNSSENKEIKEQTDEIEAGLIYRWGNFQFNPFYSFRQVLIVGQNFTDNQILDQIQGSFYFPFFAATPDFRYAQRLSKYKLSIKYQGLWIFSPRLEYLFNYFENSFRDNPDPLILSGDSFQRFRQPSSYARTNFKIDFDLGKISKKIKKTVTLASNFFREISVAENSVPFSRKTPLLHDEYGLSNRFDVLGSRVYNIFSYPFWHHFTSNDRHRNNFSKGREYVQFLNFRPDSPSEKLNDAFSEYNQRIQLRDYVNMVANWSLFSWLAVVNEAHLSQTASRSGDVGALVTQRANWGASVRTTLNLMKALNFWFWEKASSGQQNKKDAKSHQQKSSFLDMGFRYESNLRVTDNISRKHYIPETGISFNWLDHDHALHTFRFKGTLDFIHEDEDNFFISGGNASDVSIFENIQKGNRQFKKQDIGFGFSLLYALGLPSLRRWLQALTGVYLKKNPKYRIELLLDFKRFKYDIYTNFTQFPSDFYTLSQDLDVNLHTNINGRLYFKSALEVQRDPESNQARQRIVAFEIGFSVKIIF